MLGDTLAAFSPIAFACGIASAVLRVVTGALFWPLSLQWLHRPFACLGALDAAFATYAAMARVAYLDQSPPGFSLPEHLQAARRARSENPWEEGGGGGGGGGGARRERILTLQARPRRQAGGEGRAGGGAGASAALGARETEAEVLLEVCAGAAQGGAEEAAHCWRCAAPLFLLAAAAAAALERLRCQQRVLPLASVLRVQGQGGARVRINFIHTRPFYRLSQSSSVLLSRLSA
jgi:hypothetical protein